MDRFQMNRSGCRPYQYTCGMNSGMAGRTDQSFSDMAKQVPAMAYVPYQEFAPTFELKKALQEKGYQLYIDSPTNQQFIILENNKKEELAKKVRFDFWEKYDEDHTVIRFATSWGTKMEDIDALIELL